MCLSHIVHTGCTCENLLTITLYWLTRARCQDPLIVTTIFEALCSLAIHISEEYLECTETAMAGSVLTVEADGHTIDADGHTDSPEFPSRVASSSRLWLHPIAY